MSQTYDLTGRAAARRGAACPDPAEVRARALVVTLDEAALPTGLVELRSGVAAVVRSGARVLVVDVSRLGHLSSPTITALLWAQRRCRAQGSVVVLRGIGRRRMRMLQRTGLSHVFELERVGAAGSAALPGEEAS
jgi:anti-anti-sigma regulatory factor